EYLGDPTNDPHGDPIPALDGTLPDQSVHSLADFAFPQAVRVIRIRDQNADRLRYLAKLGLVPEAVIKISAIEPFDGPITVKIGRKSTALDRRLAESIFAETVDD
ncbi:MAG: FeoA domain-containing protein, partial [Pyrinomonadaceae bacterium]